MPIRFEGGLLFRCVLLLVILVLAGSERSFGQSPLDIRRSFSQELSTILLDSPELYASQGPDRGWLGVVLAVPGTSIAPMAEAYNGLSGDLARSLVYASTFDRTLQVRDGFAFFTVRTLDAVWSDLLRRSIPSSVAPAVTNTWSRWLFREPDNVELARRTIPYRAPSEYLIKYREYQLAFENLMAGRNGDAWKTDPKLAGYRTFDQAQRALLQDWTTFGYRNEIDRAQRSFQAATQTKAWSRWSESRSMYDLNVVPINLTAVAPQTVLLPPPTSWGLVSSWVRLQSRVAGVSQPISFQLQRVKLERPWLNLGALIDGSLAVDATSPENQGYVLSTGAQPTFEKSPEGEAAVLVEELLLVRGIHPPDSSASVPFSSHPLALFASPDAINLIGYVVRVLPKFPR
ncbi:hypothetical protein FBZ96_1011004 [Bradyrhizobium stylosanthis]|uniref:Uncharacterized protein n=1 Tax=Bradyrhizobium stylosanthis TaxID=1803665 RepID=A0A560ECT6_9BRAD|nr:hypothetical protein FBZ96_1011004 [Bradyrhizobium stylosanthis]